LYTNGRQIAEMASISPPQSSVRSTTRAASLANACAIRLSAFGDNALAITTRTSV
jgi:hypothetical protein